MQKKHLNQKQLEIFVRAGWTVQALKENDLTQHYGQETMLHLFAYKDFQTRTINIDYARETLLVVENDTRMKLCPRIKYDAPLPKNGPDLIWLLGTIQVIDETLSKRLQNEI